MLNVTVAIEIIVLSNRTLFNVVIRGVEGSNFFRLLRNQTKKIRTTKHKKK